MNPLDFDRAFPSTPDCIHAAIDMGFRKGQQQMKKRNKIISMCSVAAAAMILIAVAAFAAGGITAPQPDLLAQPAVHSTEAPEIEEYTVYCTTYGVYYHSDEHCSGMWNAEAHSVSDAQALGKQPCPICMVEEENAEPDLLQDFEAPNRLSELPQAASVRSDAKALSLADSNASALHRRLFRIAFGNLEDSAAMQGYAFHEDSDKNRIVLRKSLDTVDTWALYSDMIEINGGYRLNVFLDSTVLGTKRVMENISVQPLKDMYPQALALAKAYLADESPRYVERVQVDLTDAMQVCCCEIEFRASEGAFSVWFYPIDNSENEWTASIVPYVS